MPAFPTAPYDSELTPTADVYDVPNTMAELVTAANAQAVNNGVAVSSTGAGTIAGDRVWALNYSQVFDRRGDLVQDKADATVITGYERTW